MAIGDSYTDAHKSWDGKSPNINSNADLVVQEGVIIGSTAYPGINYNYSDAKGSDEYPLALALMGNIKIDTFSLGVATKGGPTGKDDERRQRSAIFGYNAYLGKQEKADWNSGILGVGRNGVFGFSIGTRLRWGFGVVGIGSQDSAGGIYGAANKGKWAGVLRGNVYIGSDTDGVNVIEGGAPGDLIVDGGSVGIGTEGPKEKLHVVNGNILVSNGSFMADGETLKVPDYIFAPAYQPMALSELDEFIKQNKHLPEIPSSQEIKAKGLDISDIIMKLLAKIEELTLYTIEQQKIISRLSEKVSSLEKHKQ